jgi:hypothetical protein
MIVGELILLLAVEGQPTETVLPQDMYVYIFSFGKCLIQFLHFFLQKQPADHWWSVDHSSTNTVLEGVFVCG